MQHIRLAVRSLLHSPGFAFTATLTLALGIGLSTAVFTVAETLLIRRLPVTDQDRLVVLNGETQNGSFSNFPLRRIEVEELALGSRALHATAFFTFEGASPATVRDGGQLYRLRRALVSGNFFDVLGSRAILGRALRPEDDVGGAAPVVVLSNKVWRERFGGDSGVLERSLLIHETGQRVRIVGVMPRGLDYPRGTDFWVPVVATAVATADSIRLLTASFDILARLRPAATLAMARAELTAYFARAGAPALEHSVRGAAHALPDIVLGDVKPAVIVLAAAAGLLLLLACINVANLLLVRGLGRVREIALRSALGASRAQLVGQLLVESAVLALAAGTAGAFVAAAAVRGFVMLAPAGTPRLDELGVNQSVLLVAVGVAAVATLVFALAPAIVTSRAELQGVLRTGAGQATGSRRFRLAREGLVAAQVALAVVVLSFAALMTRSYENLARVDLSFAPGGIVVAELALPMDLAAAGKQQLALLDRLLLRISQLPQVAAVTPALTVPFDVAGGIFGRLATPLQTSGEIAANPMLDMQVVAPDYFRTLGVAVMRGRGFSGADVAGAPPVVIVSASVARYYWPRTSPLGQELRVGSRRENVFTVIGEVPDTRYRDLRNIYPSVYFPIAQSSFPVAPLTLLVRSSRSAAGLVPALRRAIADERSGAALATATSFETLLDTPLAQPRLNAMLLSSFGGAAVLLAGIGLFAVIAATVRQRTREFGIRMALGATSGNVRVLVTRRGMCIASVGAVVGLAGALASGRIMTALLFEVRPTDALILGLTMALVLAVAAVASLVPAQSSARIDPAIALRTDG